MRAFVDEHGLGEMIQAVDDDGSLWARFGITYQPAWVFIDDTGEVEVVPGALGAEDLPPRVEQLIAS